MKLEILESIGLTKNEIKVYLALLEIGTSSSGAIIKKSDLYGTRVYDALNKLISKGLVSYFFTRNIKYFQASEPHKILEIFNEKKMELENLSREITGLSKNKISDEQKVKVYEGLNGIKFLFNTLSNGFIKGRELLVFGNPKSANDKLEPFFLEFHKKRINKETFMKIIHNEENKTYAKKRENWRLTEVRYMPKNVITPSWINIFGDKVFIFNIEDESFAIEITNKKVAQSYKEYFNILWNISTK